MTDSKEQAMEKAKELVTTWLEDFDITGEEGKNDALESRITQALLKARREVLEEAERKIQDLRDSSMLMGEGSWEVGRITGLDSAIYAIQQLKGKR